MKHGTHIAYLKKVKKKKNLLKYVLSSAEISVFYQKIVTFVISGNKDKIAFKYIFLINLNFIESLNVVSINMISIWMTSAIFVTPGLLKIDLVWNQDYKFIISVYDVINKILPNDSSWIVDLVMHLKFDNSSISMRKVIVDLTFWRFYQKKQFFEGGLVSSSITWNWYKAWPWNFAAV